MKKPPQWSPTGEWIVYEIAGGLSLISPDGKLNRRLTTNVFTIFGFSKDGSQVFGMYLNREEKGRREFFSVDVKTGAQKFLAIVNLPASVNRLAGFSLHPDGKRFATSISKMKADIWMLEGFDKQKTLLQLLLGH